MNFYGNGLWVWFTAAMLVLVSFLASFGVLYSGAGLESAGLIAAAAACVSVISFLMCVSVCFVKPMRTLHEHLERVEKRQKMASGAYEGVGLQELHASLGRIASIMKKEHALSTGLWKGIPMAYLLVDTDERTTSTNQACLDMLEISDTVENCLGRTLADLFYNDPARETAVGKSMKNGDVFSNLEVTITGRKGRKVHVLANVFPIYDSDKVCVGGLCLYADITRLKDAELLVLEKNRKMADAAGQLKATASTVLSYANELSSAIDESGRNSAEAAEKLSHISHTMNEMNATVQDIARNAAQASETSDETKVKAQSGADVVKKSMDGICGVRDVSEQLKGDMSQLDTHAQSISQIMGVISDIADQTNLLALNAAIEAARAGESGRGFAVVADEVRKLAEKTMTSTIDVGKAIEAIQQSTTQSMSSMDHALNQVNQATNLAGLSGQALQEILQTVDATAGQVNGIALACEAQSNGTREITEAIQQADIMVRQSAETMEKISSAVSELANQAHGMNDLIRKLES